MPDGRSPHGHSNNATSAIKAPIPAADYQASTPCPMTGIGALNGKDSMSGISPVQGGQALTQLRQARLVEDSPAEEKTESRAKEAAETATDQAKKAASTPSPSSRTIDTHA